MKVECGHCHRILRNTERAVAHVQTHEKIVRTGDDKHPLFRVRYDRSGTIREVLR